MGEARKRGCNIAVRITSGKKGFTLLELSIALVIIAIITGISAYMGTAVIATARLSATQQRMKAIDQALMKYRVANDRLPCPADLTIPQGGANFGIEGATPGACTGGTPSANFSAASTTYTFATAAEGAVPTVTLGLPNDFMVDGWGNRFRYAVDTGMTAPGAFPAMSLGCAYGAVTVNDANGNGRTQAAIYALISHGANGHGAYTQNGVTLNARSVNASEQTNCHCNASAAPTGYAPVYVQASSSVDSTNALDNFDDLVTYKERWQMRTDWDDATACKTVYVADSANCRVQYFTITGGYLGQFGTCGTNPGQFNMPTGIAIDQSGNVWVTDYGLDAVQKFSSSGSYISGFGCCAFGSSTGNGEFNEADGVAVDSSGNLWVTDKDNNRIQKFNTSGTWLMTIGGDKGDGSHTCTQCSSTTSCTCYSGTGNGQFTYPEGNVVIDSGGNIWAYDGGNSRVQEFNSSGSWLQTVNTGAGFQNGFALDASGNIWASSDGYHVRKFTSTGTDTGVYMDKGDPGCCEGPANGLNYGTLAFAIDANGDIWIVDPWNNRVEEFNSSGTWLRSIGGPPPYACETSPAGSQPACAAGSSNGQFSFTNGFGSIAITSR